MTFAVETKDCTALADAELADMADIVTDGPAGFDIGLVSKQAEEWVLITQVRDAGKLVGFSFCTLERIGGTPCLLWGLASVKRNAKRDQVLKAIIAAQFRRAVLAFPDEDVLIGTRFIDAGAFQAFKGLEDICPRPGHKPTGEERAWSRRLAKRFGAEGRIDDRTLHRDRRRQRPRVLRLRLGQARERAGRRGRLLRAARPRARRRADRLRLGHGRGPGRQVRPLTPAVGGPRSARGRAPGSGPGQHRLDHLVAAALDRWGEGDQQAVVLAGGHQVPATGAVHERRPGAGPGTAARAHGPASRTGRPGRAPPATG